MKKAKKITTITKQMSFTQTLARIADTKAEALGLSTAEYIRHLIVNDNQKKTDTEKRTLSPKAELQYLQDIVEFLKEEQTNPRPAARSGQELLDQLEHDERY